MEQPCNLVRNLARTFEGLEKLILTSLTTLTDG
jgi:hypothetical protein